MTVGQDASTETVESSAAYIFDVFKDAEKVSHRETMSLKSIFGPFPATEATNACTIVNHIVSWLPEDMLWLISSQVDTDIETEFGRSIKLKKPAPTSYDDSSSDSEEVERPHYDLKYSEMKTEKISPVVVEEIESFNKSWLESEVSKYFDTEFGLGMTDLCTTIFDVLISLKTDEALQNDVCIFMPLTT